MIHEIPGRLLNKTAARREWPSEGASKNPHPSMKWIDITENGGKNFRWQAFGISHGSIVVCRATVVSGKCPDIVLDQVLRVLLQIHKCLSSILSYFLSKTSKKKGHIRYAFAMQ